MSRVLLLLSLFGLLICAQARLSPTARQIVLHDRVVHTLYEEHELTNTVEEQQWLIHVSPTIDIQATNNALSPYKLGVYFPHNTYLLVAPSSVLEKVKSLPQVLWVGKFLPEFKLAKNLSDKLKSTDGTLLIKLAPQVESDPFKRTIEDASKIAKQWEANFNIPNIQVSFKAINRDRIQCAVSPSSAALAVAEFVSLQSTSHYIDVVRNYQFHNKYAKAAVVNAQVPITGYYNVNFNGSGQIIGLADTGLDQTSCYFAQTTPANNQLNSAATKVVRYVSANSGDTTDQTGHGTFVAGTIAGNTANSPNSEWNGVATGAKLHVTDLSNGNSDTIDTPTNILDYLLDASADGASIFTLTIGATSDWYTDITADIDDFVYTDDVLLVVSSGNEGTKSSLSDIAMAKNAISVGASQNFPETTAGANLPVKGLDVLASFSSQGPTPDGRIKPDVVAPGQRITSAALGACNNVTREGTSYAAAVVAGAAALVRQYFADSYFPTGQSDPSLAFYTNPSAALVKAMLIHSAQPLLTGVTPSGTYESLSGQLPSGAQGYGRIQLDRVLYVNTPSFTSDYNLWMYEFPNAQPLATSKSQRNCFQILPGSSYLKVTLVWTDPAAAPTAGALLVNDLDLVVYNQQGQSWRASTSNGEFDSSNNVEQIFIQNPQPGYYAIQVYGQRVTGTQDWASVITGNFTVADVCTADFDRFDSITNPVCANGCSGRGTCGPDGVCTCNQGYTGVDCSKSPCPSNCGGNGICNYETATCECGLDYDPTTACTTIKAPETPQAPPPAVEVQQSQEENIGLYVGVAVLGFVVGAVVFAVIGFFCAVRYLEKKRDEAAGSKGGNAQEMS